MSLPALKMPSQATIQTYATSANLGPLFDRAGAKLDGLYMTTSGQLTTAPGLSIVRSDGAYPIPTDETNLAHKVAGRIFDDYKIRDGLALSLTNDMKPGGLGTSGAGAVAVVELLNYLHNLGMTAEQKLDYALEGEQNRHPDNVVPCMIGGVVLAAKVKGSEGQDHLVYSKLTPSPDLAYGVVIPLDIIKSGGTTEARKKVEALSHSNAEAVYLSGLAELMMMGLLEGNFEKIFESVKAYSEWEKSVTFVRNQPTEENPRGIYGIDVNRLNHGLEAVVGREAIVTPSGAGPAMLVFTKDQEAAEKAISVLTETYHMSGKRARGFVASIRNKESKDDFV